MFKVLSLGPDFNEFTIANTNGYLTSLENINLFIGTNNSGKSRFIRAMFNSIISSQSTRFISNEYDYKIILKDFNTSYRRAVRLLMERMLNEYDIPNHQYAQKLFQSFSDLPSDQIDFRLFIAIATFFTKANTKEFIPREAKADSKNILETLAEDMKKRGAELNSFLNKAFTSKNHSPNCLYIPVLRGLRPIHYNETTKKFDSIDVYTTRTVKDYFPKPGTNDGNLDKKIFTGLSIYEDITKLLLGTVPERQLIKDFEQFLSLHIFQGQEITLIPKHKEDVLHIKIGEADQYPIYNLGDGIQTLIAILFPVFIRKGKETYVFMEEPEIHLHPKLQRSLIDALQTMDTHQYFISTHSAIFMNTEKTCTYSVSKETKGFLVDLIKINTNKRILLENLGYKASDVLLSNYILWVEGVTDKIYFEYWIRTYTSGALEINKHYNIMMYHGSFENHIDLATFLDLSSRFGVYIDSDRYSNSMEHSPKEKLELEKKIKDSDHFCWVSGKRAIENYIPHNVYLEAINKVYPHSKLELEDGDFIDRGFARDTTKIPEYKQRIKLPDSIWSIIQKNKDGKTSGIDGKQLRIAVESAISETSSSNIKIDKVRVAEMVISLNPGLIDLELIEKISELVKGIRSANHLED